MHGQVWDVSNLKKFPKRESFYDVEENKRVSKKVENLQSLLFMPIGVKDTNWQIKQYDKSKYHLMIYGILEDGRIATVIIRGIKPFFEIIVPEGMDAGLFAQTWFAKLSNHEFQYYNKKILAEPLNYEIISGFKFLGYGPERKFVRIYFNKLNQKNAALKYVQQDHETFSNDKTCYYRVVCRDNETTFASWVKISDYKIREYKNIKGKCFVVHINKYKKHIYDVLNDKKLSKDKTLAMTWDIETFHEDGELPLPDDPKSNMFMIGMTFHWHYDKEALFRVVLVDYPCDPHKDFLAIVCHNEANLIKAFGKIIKKMRPQLIEGFNDSLYDWPWLALRAKQHNIFAKFIKNIDISIPWKPNNEIQAFKKHYKSHRVKIESSMTHEGNSIVCDHFINVDIRTVFRRLYRTSEESSLNFYLKSNKMDKKDDMPIGQLFKIYKACKESKDDISPDLRKKMTKVAHYCVIDAQRCHELFVKRSVLMDSRETADLSFVSLSDAFYRADGMKVRNLVISEGQKRKIRFSNISNMGPIDQGKYPGAFVFPPVKGLKTSKLNLKDRHFTQEQIDYAKPFIEKYGVFLPKEKLDKLNMKPFLRKFFEEETCRPVTGLDFSSLYPSIIMDRNLSPEKVILNKSKAKELAKRHTLHKIKFPFNGRTIRGWSIRHDNIFDEKDPNFKFGIYPSILKRLYDDRKELKKELHHWEAIKEKLEADKSDRSKTEEFRQEYDKVMFNFNYINSKQKALKVFMNTFYGEAGCKTSPFFMLQIAGGITSEGQRNVKSAHDFVVERGCKVVYGDTDSIYVMLPDHYFSELDKKYYLGKISRLQYWTEMVNLTFKIIKPLNDEMNVMFKQVNGTNFIKTDYEEALFPVAFLAKKKYYGIPHISFPNFQPEKLFIRGLEVKKRGVSTILKKVCMRLMWKSVDVENKKNLLDLVLETIDQVYKTKWKLEDFIMTGVFKPGKKNVQMHTFNERMTERGFPVEPNERFKYVMVKKYPYKFDTYGRKKALQAGDKMEYYQEAKEKNMNIDLDYYMSGGINGQMARLIVYHDQFHTDPDDDTDASAKKAENKIYEKACKFVEKYCQKHYAKYTNKGAIYKKIHSISSKSIFKIMENKIGKNDALEIFKARCEDLSEFKEWILEKASRKAKIFVKKFMKTYEFDGDAVKMQGIYYAYQNNLLKMREIKHRAALSELKEELDKKSQELTKIFSSKKKWIKSISDFLKQSTNIDNELEEEIQQEDSNSLDKIMEDILSADLKNIEEKQNNEIEELLKTNYAKNLNDLKLIYIKLYCEYEFIYKTRAIVEFFKKKRNEKLDFYNIPKENKKEIININIDEMMREMSSSSLVL